MNVRATVGGAADDEITYGIGRLALGDLLRRSARRFPNKIAVVDSRRRTTFAELNHGATRFANYLLKSGIPIGSKISTFCGNHADYIKIIYGIHKAGMVWVPINTVLAPADMGQIVRHAESVLVVIDADIHSNEATRSMIGALDVPTLVVGSDFDALLAAQGGNEPVIQIHERDLALIMYTSGTTSLPKGAMHCHMAVYAGTMSNIHEWRIVRDDCLLIVLPMFHVAAHCLFTAFMSAGATVVLQQGFDAGAALAAFEQERVTFFVGLPMMYRSMLDHPACPDTNLSSLRFCVYTMAPMPQPLLLRLMKEFCPTFALTSGQTEMYPMTVMFRPEQQLQRFGNYWGEAVLVNDLAIMDDEGNLLSPGEIGEIVHRGPNVMLGYYKNPEATAEARKFGWHHTGDLGLIDPDGQLLFIDRKKDMIKTGGENVASVKVEEALLRHPGVENAAVIGVPHPKWGEAIVACVTSKPGHTHSETEIIAHCKSLLGGFEVPKAVEFLEDMPLTATSKLRKVELRERFLTKFQAA